MHDRNAPDPLAVCPRDAARMLSIGTRKLWALTAPRGPIPCTRAGTRVLYRVDDLDRWLGDCANSIAPAHCDCGRPVAQFRGRNFCPACDHADLLAALAAAKEANDGL